MDIDQFSKHLADIAPALKAWGDVVAKAIESKLKAESIHPQIISARVKELDSAVGKIGRKKYTDPLSEMTDLVGVRAVVLLSPDLRRIKDLVEESDEWEAKLARDPEEETQEDPERFDYQSLHFELRSKTDREIDNITLPAGICCELQVRTLMQHTYAEVVHNQIYKRTWDAPAKARRYVASSAALIDTADHLFCETMSLLQQENAQRGAFLDELCSLHESIAPGSSGRDQKLNMIVLSEFEDSLEKNAINAIENLLRERPYIAERITSRLKSDPFWMQPISILAYWLVSSQPRTTFKRWPFASSHDALELVYSDLGENP